MDRRADADLSRESILTKGSRFYTPDTHYSKESIEQGRTCSRKVGTEKNVSDMMTKNVAAATFKYHVPMVCGYENLPPIPPPPRK